MITTFFPPMHFGGDAIFVANLANALVQDGHHVEVVHCADSFHLLQKGVPASTFPLDPRVRIHALHSAFGALSPILTYATGQPYLKSGRLTEILGKGFDVVHWHNLSLVGGPGALKLAGGVRLCTLHDYWFICPTNILFKYNREACTDRNCVKCSLIYNRPPQTWRSGPLMEQSIGDVDRFLAPSEFVKQQYADSPLHLNTTVLPLFMPRMQAAPRENQGDYYLSVGRLERAKGLQTILHHFSKPGRRLLVAGAGTFDVELRRLARDLPQVEFLGRVPYSDLPALYAGARATIVPSLCYETFGLTVLESLQQKTPVIVSNYGALPETVAHTGGGVVFHDSAELKQVLERFDVDDAYVAQLGEQGNANLEQYSPQTHLRRYYEVIDAVRK